jgi:hypothetical protein
MVSPELVVSPELDLLLGLTRHLYVLPETKIIGIEEALPPIIHRSTLLMLPYRMRRELLECPTLRSVVSRASTDLLIVKKFQITIR